MQHVRVKEREGQSTESDRYCAVQGNLAKTPRSCFQLANGLPEPTEVCDGAAEQVAQPKQGVCSTDLWWPAMSKWGMGVEAMSVTTRDLSAMRINACAVAYFALSILLMLGTSVAHAGPAERRGNGHHGRRRARGSVTASRSDDLPVQVSGFREPGDANRPSNSRTRRPEESVRDVPGTGCAGGWCIDHRRARQWRPGACIVDVAHLDNGRCCSSRRSPVVSTSSRVNDGARIGRRAAEVGRRLAAVRQPYPHVAGGQLEHERLARRSRSADPSPGNASRRPGWVAHRSRPTDAA